jgi:hypothetical protein
MKPRIQGVLTPWMSGSMASGHCCSSEEAHVSRVSLCCACPPKRHQGQSGGTVGISIGNEIRRVPGDQTYQPWGMLAAIVRRPDVQVIRGFAPTAGPVVAGPACNA